MSLFERIVFGKLLFNVCMVDNTIPMVLQIPSMQYCQDFRNGAVNQSLLIQSN